MGDASRGRTGEAGRFRRLDREEPAADTLRYRQRQDFARELIRRSAALPPEDAALLHELYERGARLPALAAERGSPARTLRRRIDELTRRVMSDEFALVLRQGRGWPAERRSVAEAVIIRGRSYREAGESLGLSLHRIRGHAAAISAMCDASRLLSAELAAGLARLETPHD